MGERAICPLPSSWATPAHEASDAAPGGPTTPLSTPEVPGQPTPEISALPTNSGDAQESALLPDDSATHIMGGHS